MQRIFNAKIHFYISRLQDLGSKTSLQMAEDQAIQYLNCSGDEGFEIAQAIPGILLRQDNKEQKCYDFHIWWLNLVIKYVNNQRWPGSCPPFEEKNINLLEPLDNKILSTIQASYYSLSLMIIKLRLFHGFHQFKTNFYYFLHGTINESNLLHKFSGNHLILQHIFEFACFMPSHASIEKPYCKNARNSLTLQIKQIFDCEYENNFFSWKVLVNPELLGTVRKLDFDYGPEADQRKADSVYEQLILAFNKLKDEIGDSMQIFYNHLRRIGFEWEK